ncbi:DUF1499 domain-containing protein [Haliangium ochraceum]|uniref:DUF1499 domain-containing protein n=1 Tax=Haliangium ochraceum (strain DSM 14365 / JCM 11303 / SMP-2) TaxID=502025 RepID=D0LZI7_HALO1|nr:DUF1499 domain-containing protein [Haliangium ochraceum]ACY17966.1 conserved hypothetical protein [Haliangium ochraceum DSM 14365]
MPFLLLCLSLVCLLLGPAAAYFELVPALWGFYGFLVGGLLGALASLGALINLLRKRGRRSLAVLVLGLLPVATVLAPALQAGEHPPINDISSDLEDPPALASGAPYPPEFVPIVRDSYPEVSTLRVAAAPAAVFDAARALAAEREGWSVAPAAGADEAAADSGARSRSLQGVATTALFRFRDDFSIRVRGTEGGSAVDMRSRSRDGKGDLGANAARIRAFLRDLEAALARP